MKKILFMLFLLILLTGCGKKNQVDLLGAGATFPQPLYEKMFKEFNNETNIRISYHGIGSGGGIFRLKNRKADFGATDIIVNEKDFSEDIVHIPICLGAVAITYNLPANPQINFTPEILTAIFTEEITNWNDKKLTALNPDIILPNQRILVANRSDESGTTNIFNDYLCKVSNKWKSYKKNPLKKMFELSASNNSTMAILIKETFGAIGYMSLSYARSNNIPYGKIMNLSGNFIAPELKSVSNAATRDTPEDTRIYLTNTKAEKGYPISSFSWLILYKDLGFMEKEKAEKLINLVNWMLHDGQKYSPSLHYAQLPLETVRKAEVLLKSVTWNNKKIN
ncbi:MAG: phosphate ABC transporter substrate-binding protein PstS [Candidatus Cloacimonetes bacterium]|nr:phosphate ABC transporter substrate-binding protein PstS [Candidatus Cloacimonadota bacterium]